MLTGGTKYRLYLFFKAVSENENFVEDQRQTLGGIEEYNTYAAFKRIEACGTEMKNTICAADVVKFLTQNHVDYIKETDLFRFFQTFDKDKDGNLDYDDFLQFALPYDNMKLRAKVSQRPPFVSKDKTLPRNVEFELTRLFEKEVHLGIKVELEKKCLELQGDFCTVSLFTFLDPLRYGFVDFDRLHVYLK